MIETQNLPQQNLSAQADPGWSYALRIVHSVCCLAGSTTYLDDVRAELRGRGVIRAVRERDTPALFDWLIETFSLQGVSDAAAAGFMAQHGTVRWASISEAVSRAPSCPKLDGYWRFHDCRYQKDAYSCAEPGLIDTCPLPLHPLRNGRLNQMAYSLYFFMRDVANNDLVSWIDGQLAGVDPNAPDRPTALREAVIGPLRNVYGVSDKVLAMTMSSLLMAAGARRPRWVEAAATFLAVDTLVHNFLHRTGILRRTSSEHPYGVGCYRAGGCVSILDRVAKQIDARQFNASFPATFPRFVQSAIWAYCAQGGLNICNGNRIDDRSRCDNEHCQIFRKCDRRILH